MSDFKAIEEVASVEDFLRLRENAGLSPKTRELAERGLPNSLYGVQVKDGDHAVAMGRVVGDGGLNFEIVDIAVEPAYQGKGLGRVVMQHIMAYLEQAALPKAYISLIGDEPAFYERFGFKSVRPASDGMYMLAPVKDSYLAK